MLGCSYGFHTNHGHVMLFPSYVAQLQDLVMLNPSIYLSDCFSVQLYANYMYVYYCFVVLSMLVKEMLPKYRKTNKMLPNFNSISLPQYMIKIWIHQTSTEIWIQHTTTSLLKAYIHHYCNQYNKCTDNNPTKKN